MSTVGVALISVALFVVLAIAARSAPLVFDGPVTAALAPLGDGPARTILDMINAAGDLLPWVALLAVAAGMTALTGRRGDLVLAGGLAAELLTLVAKLAVARVRPDTAELLELAMEQSFPSGHVARVTVVAGSLLVVFRPRGWRLAASAALVVVLASLMGVARVALGAHFPSDVLGGYLLSAIVLTVVTLATDRDPGEESSPSR